MPSRQDLRRIIAVAELDTPITFEVAAPNEAEGTKADGTEEMGPPQTIELLPALWPTELAPALPQSLTSVGDSKTPASPSQEETPQPDASAEKVVEIAEISLGDFPNTAYAVVPLASNARPLGLLILFPEPGDLSQEKAQAYWQEFCVSQGWIVAVLNSGDPRRWSREEVDLAARILGKLENAYELDKQRIVLGGIGVGGKLALVAAAAQVGRVTGVATLGTELKNIGLRVENAPLRSLDFLLLGTPSDLNNTAKSLRDLGYSAIVVDAPKLTTGSLESIPAAPLTRWLEGLGRL